MEISIHFTLFYSDSLPVSVEEVPGLQHSVLPGREEQGHPDGAPATSSQSDTLTLFFNPSQSILSH